MLVVIVHALVKSEFIDQFIAATTEIARSSSLEPGIARFDFYQQADDPTRFVLHEIYRSDDAPEIHRATPHYKEWRTLVDPLMAEPRSRIEYQLIYPRIQEG